MLLSLEHIKTEGPAWYEVSERIISMVFKLIVYLWQTDPLLDLVFVPEDEEKLKGVYRILMKV